MPNVERVSISVDPQRIDGLRSLVQNGTYPSLSAAFAAAADVLMAKEAEQAAWWAETLRRCDEAEKHPERLLDVDSFFRGLREEIGTLKSGRREPV